MLRTAAIFLLVVGFVAPAIAQEKERQLPENTIDCKQFKKTGPREWIEVGIAVFDLGKIKDINLTDQPVTPGFFKFGGIDVYPVLEQKCGAVASFNMGNVAQAKGEHENAVADYLPPSNTTAKTPMPSQQAAAFPRTELEHDENASASVQAPTQATMNVLVPTSESEIVKSQSESTSCGDRKSVYVANGLADAEGGRTLIEIVFNNNVNGEEQSRPDSDFIIRGYRNKKLEWIYKGKNIRGRFLFIPVRFNRQNSFLQSIFAPVHSSRKNPLILALNYVKPNRDGTGDPILYLSGLRTLFSSKESVHRFKFEGKRPAEPLPEAFYFDRCE